MWCLMCVSLSLSHALTRKCIQIYFLLLLLLRSYFIYGFYLFPKWEKLLSSDGHTLTIQPNLFSFCSTLFVFFISYFRSLYVSTKDKRINVNTRLTNAQAQLSSAYIHIPSPVAFLLCIQHNSPSPSYSSISFKTFASSFSYSFVCRFFLRRSCIHDSWYVCLWNLLSVSLLSSSTLQLTV